MSDQDDRRRPHFILERRAQSERFQSPAGGPSGATIPPQNRQQHGGRLSAQVAGLHAAAEQARAEQIEAGMEDGLGIQVEFESFPDIELAFESLAHEGKRIELLNVRSEGGKTLRQSLFRTGSWSILSGIFANTLRRNAIPRVGQETING